MYPRTDGVKFENMKALGQYLSTRIRKGYKNLAF